MIECMFDSEFAGADDATVVAAIEESTREEAAAGARRLAAIAELAHRRVADEGERALWAFDGWDGAAAEVAAAMGVGHRRASGQMRIATVLRDRLPRVAALYLQGLLSSRVVSVITWRTQLVDDPEALALIDAAIADRATRWGALSERKLDAAIDAWIARYDPAALRHTEDAARSRDFNIGDLDDPAGVTSVWGRLLAVDAAVLKKRIADMVAGVCDEDPRSMGERRSDAVGAILAGAEHLVCECGSEACPSAGQSRPSNVVVHVLAEQAAVDAATATPPQACGDKAAATAPAPTGEAATTSSLDSATNAPAALILGGGVLPNPLLREVIRGGATVKPIRMPSEEPESGYRLSKELAEFVRMRDLFCRFPGCDVPADRCDIDHTIPYPDGPTHASNLKCLCRTNHLMKTFGGWDDLQLPDGTVVWTSPSGRKYTTKPGSRLFFPMWDTTTADLPPPSLIVPSAGDRGLMMPRRRRTRAAQDAAYIKAERAKNLAPF
jgi:hypothetical protein